MNEYDIPYIFAKLPEEPGKAKTFAVNMMELWLIMNFVSHASSTLQSMDRGLPD